MVSPPPKREYFNRLVNIQDQETLWKELKTFNICSDRRVQIYIQLSVTKKINNNFFLNFPGNRSKNFATQNLTLD